MASRAKTKLDDIRSIKSQIAMLRKLMKGGQLKRILKCPFCKCPRVKPLHRRRGMPNWYYRCMAKKCHKSFSPVHNSKVFRCERGGVALKERVAILWCAVWRVPQALVHAMIKGVGKDVVDAVYNDWRAVLAEFSWLY